MENTTLALHVIKINTCPECEVPPQELGPGTNNHWTRNDDRHDHQGVKRGKCMFQELERVSVPDLHLPDLLQAIYLALFKHSMDERKGFLKKHYTQEAFDDGLKTLPTYP